MLDKKAAKNALKEDVETSLAKYLKGRFKESNKRLLKLAELLDTVPPKQFDMGTWKCGTTACAAGWAASDKWFKDRGLTLIPDRYWDDPEQWEIKFGQDVAFAAAAKFFLVTYEEAELLFGNDSATPKQEAKILRKFVENRKLSKSLVNDVFFRVEDVLYDYGVDV